MLSPRTALGAYVVVAAATVLAAATESVPLEWATKLVLMPLLAAYLVLAARRDGVPVDGRLLAGTVFAWLGDVMLISSGTGFFIAGMALFLAVHICYIAAFTRGGAARALLRPPLVAVPIGYAVLTVAALAWMWSGLSEAGLAIPIAIYALALATTATTAAAHGWQVAVGAGLFLVSDLLIAVRVAEVAELAGPPIWVMLTYVLAQGLIVTGWARRWGRSRPQAPVRAAAPAAA
jgi:uncharacterized membrane protein YhhN